MMSDLSGSLAISALAALLVTPCWAAQDLVTTPDQWSDAQVAYLAWNSANPGWTRTNDGLEYRLLSDPHASAPRPELGCPVTVDYEGRLIDGALFDASSAHKGPATFPLNHLIRGWQEGLMLMHVGETFALAIPASLAYRAKWIVQDNNPFVSIPAGSALLFKIELVALPVCARTTPASN